MNVNEVAQLALELGTPERVAARLNVQPDTAAQMIAFARREREQERERERMQSILEAEAHRANVLSARDFATENPAYEHQDMGFRKEVLAMQRMSRELLKAMLRTGQHRLTPEAAAAKKRELGIDLLLV